MKILLLHRNLSCLKNKSALKEKLVLELENAIDVGKTQKEKKIFGFETKIG